MLTGLAPGSTCATVRPDKNALLSIQPRRSTTSRCTQDCTPPPSAPAPRRTKVPRSCSKPTSGRTASVSGAADRTAGSDGGTAGRAARSDSGGMARGRQLRQLRLVCLVHPRFHAVFLQCVAEQLANHLFLVGIVDLIAADAPADPGLRHALRVADRDRFMLEGEVSSRRRARVEMLVKPQVGRN